MAHAPLHPDARSFLAREVGRARVIAEKGAHASLTAMAVADKVVPAHFTEAQRKLRNRLRAHARQLGDERTADGQQDIHLLTEEVAYQHWHRMLFARFLAENGLLREDEGDQPIDLDECRALAADRRLDTWVYAALCAQKMLPGVFRLDDPALELKLDGAAQVELNGLMAGLQPEIFKATDSLGWVYQYWQAKRKDEVNLTGVKIGAKELSAVTQIFTEDYMVDFLLHNTLGAWWAGRMGPIEAATEEEARAKAGLAAKNGLPAIVWSYLRLVQDAETKKWTPAGGHFEAWPKKAKDITFLDPCMGSGHFPVFALPILVRMRMEEEGNLAQENVYYVLKDQIHGLELDLRCCQIGAFNLALTAWKIAGFQPLPALNVACCGIAPRSRLEEWVKLAGESEKLRAGMARLHKLFEQAPVLGSLINPRLSNGDLLTAEYKELRPLLDLAFEGEDGDEASRERTVIARGLAKAADILSGQFVLVATNVPYLGRSKQNDTLRDYCSSAYPLSKADLATCFIERCTKFCDKANGTAVMVTPQNWLFLGTYASLRDKYLRSSRLNILSTLGPKGFQTPMWDFNVALLVVSPGMADEYSSFAGFDVTGCAKPGLKAAGLRTAAPVIVNQIKQLKNPDSVVSLSFQNSGTKLGDFARVFQGIGTSDFNRYTGKFWEFGLGTDWSPYHFAPESNTDVSGYYGAVRWEGGKGDLSINPSARVCGQPAWGKVGIKLSVNGDLPRSVYDGGLFYCTLGALIPNRPEDLLPIYCFITQETFPEIVRSVDQALSVTESSFQKVGFDLEHWKSVSRQKYPNGLPKPYSSDPSQWVFNGFPYKSANPLQVAVARLLCFQWPRQSGLNFPDCPALGADGLEKYADDDGVVALSSINREEAAAPRVRALLKDAFRAEWQEGITERQLLADAGHGNSTLEEWLRDSFFEEHCKLFHHRPFIWHIWDGERDGFHALVNYHRLAAPNGDGARLLQKLAQTYLGDWIARCEADVKNDRPNAHKLLKAAKDLQADLLKILEGEAPHDIFVRWKPLHEQPIGWNPDINDGVRLNIRPFLKVRDIGKKGAGILKFKPNVKWDKDRGSEPQRPKAQFPWFWSCLPEDKPDHVTDFAGGPEFTGERWNNLHYTLAAKQAARAKSSTKK